MGATLAGRSKLPDRPLKMPFLRLPPVIGIFYCNLLLYVVSIIAYLLFVNSFFANLGRFMTLLDRIKDLAQKNSTNLKGLEVSAGLGNGTIRRWDSSPPSADKLLKVANLLNTTMDYLMNGQNNSNTISLPISEDIEWLNLIHRLPEKKQIEFRAKIEGYLECYEESVAADEPLKKTGTTNSAK